MSSGIQKTPELLQGEKADVLHCEDGSTPDLLDYAFEGENREHEMGVWEAAKSHPWACLWAFVMCFTIVCSLSSSQPPLCRNSSCVVLTRNLMSSNH
jgi:SP family general alpha glucoside:H+ symporter-like MFS transporter